MFSTLSKPPEQIVVKKSGYSEKLKNNKKGENAGKNEVIKHENEYCSCGGKFEV